MVDWLSQEKMPEISFCYNYPVLRGVLVGKMWEPFTVFR